MSMKILHGTHAYGAILLQHFEVSIQQFLDVFGSCAQITEWLIDWSKVTDPWNRDVHSCLNCRVRYD